MGAEQPHPDFITVAFLLLLESENLTILLSTYNWVCKTMKGNTYSPVFYKSAGLARCETSFNMALTVVLTRQDPSPLLHQFQGHNNCLFSTTACQLGNSRRRSTEPFKIFLE